MLKLNVEVDMENFFDEYGYCFEEKAIAEEIKERLISHIVAIRAEDFSRYDWNKYIKGMIDDNKDFIINAVIENVSDRIIKKKEISAQTPKAQELASINKENEKYFMKLIDKAIAKRFK